MQDYKLCSTFASVNINNIANVNIILRVAKLSDKNFARIQYSMAKGYMENVIRGVPDGDMHQMSLSDVNEASYRAKVSQLNRKDGYKHYSVFASRTMNVMCIKNNGDKSNI